ncbi:MAG: ATP-dependent zinc metalloprotease FtsH [Candidatus Muiribacteriota bacterium]
MDKRMKNVLFYALIIIIIVIILNNFLTHEAIKELSYSEFKDTIRSGNITKLEIIGMNVKGEFSTPQTDPATGMDFKKFETAIHPMFSEILADELDEFQSQNLIAKPEPETTWWFELLVNWFPFIFFIMIWFYILNKMNGAGSKAMSFGKSKAKFSDPSAQKTTFKDVAGCDESKAELEEVIEFLKDPKKFQKLGGQIPKGVLLVGPPGTGKTLLARAVSGEAKVPFLHISGSDFVEMFVGVGASRVRDLFTQAEKRKPCIVFIDEIDAVGRQRGAGLGGGHDEREQTLNQLLVDMDGFEANTGIVVMAATNRPDILDPALLRPGRFDRQIVVDLPDIKGRHEILKVHTKKIPLDDTVKLKVIAKTTPGLSGADLANLANEAALLAARENVKKIGQKHFEEARDKVTMGVERKSKVISEHEKKITAYHEAGHALISLMVKECDPLHKVTIIPRGRALGVTHSIPEDDRYLYSEKQFYGIIKKAMGGRVAEEIVFDVVSTGASNDIAVATNIAHNMVCVYGMSKEFGPLSFGKREQHVFLGKEMAQIKDYSEATAQKIDEEIKKIVVDCYNSAKEIISENKDKLETLAVALLKFETLSREQINKLMDGEELEENKVTEIENEEVEPKESEEKEESEDKEKPSEDE